MANHTKKFDDAWRARIIQDIRDTGGTPDGTYRKLGARHGCAISTVQKIAKENNLLHLWAEGQAATAAATAAKVTNAAERRAALQLDLLDDAQKLRSKLFGDVVHLNVVKRDGPMAGEQVEETVLPAGPRDWRDTMSAIGIASSKSVELSRLEAEQAGTGATGALLDQFLGALVRDREERTDPPPSEAE